MLDDHPLHHPLFLLLLDPKTGAPIAENASALLVAAGIGELLLREELALTSNRETPVSIGPNPHSDTEPFLGSLYRMATAGPKPPTARTMAERAQARLGPLRTVGEELTELGVVRHERPRLLGLFPTDRYWICDLSIRDNLISDMVRALRSSEPPGTREAILIALCERSSRFRALVGGEVSKECRPRLRSLTRLREPAAGLLKQPAAQEIIQIVTDIAVLGSGGSGHSSDFGE